jgi:hypothetical protein
MLHIHLVVSTEMNLKYSLRQHYRLAVVNNEVHTFLYVIFIFIFCEIFLYRSMMFHLQYFKNIVLRKLNIWWVFFVGGGN